MMKRQGQSRQVHATGVDARQTVLFWFAEMPTKVFAAQKAGGNLILWFS
jgi:hypothetical protein